MQNLGFFLSRSKFVYFSSTIGTKGRAFQGLFRFELVVKLCVRTSLYQSFPLVTTFKST